MAKFGYTCRCGWRLNRGTGANQLTRKEYAKAKRDHANGVNESADAQHQPEPCGFLAAELKRTPRPAR